MTETMTSLAVECQYGAEPAGTPGGGQRRARIEVSTVRPAHGSGEVLIASGEVGTPGEQPQVGNTEGLDLVRWDKASKAALHRRRW